MPMTEDIFRPSTCRLAVWKIDESVLTLTALSPLTTHQEKEIALRKIESDQQGYLAARLALKQLGVSPQTLTTAPDGAPLIPQGHCSLSHSRSYAAAVTSKTPVGVDLETHRQQIQRIANKFIHPNEKQWIALDDIPALTRLWTAKEAIYKVVRQAGLSFAQAIEVHPFEKLDQLGTAEVLLTGKTQRFSLEYSTFHQHELTIAKPEEYERIH